MSISTPRGQVQSETGAVVFPSRLLRAEVAINGFDVQYADGDHHVFRQIVDARIENIQDRTVFFRVDFLLRDSSGNIDDPFRGRVDVLVIADIERERVRPPVFARELEQPAVG